MGGVMVIVVVNEGLEVPNLYLLFAALALHQRVQLDERESLRLHVVLQQFLDDLVALQLVRGQPQNVEGLLLCNEPTLYPQPLLSHLLPALVAELFHLVFCSFLLEVLHDLFHAFFEGKGAHMQLVGMAGRVLGCVLRGALLN